MAHFARVINGLVVEVIVAEQTFIDTLNIKNWEQWIKTSYNVRGGVYYDPETNTPHENQGLINEDEGRKRKNFAGVGCQYDSLLDAFIPPTPYPSWTLNQDTCLWDPPIPYPQDHKRYIWNEVAQEWAYTGYHFINGQWQKE